MNGQEKEGWIVAGIHARICHRQWVDESEWEDQMDGYKQLAHDSTSRRNDAWIRQTLPTFEFSSINHNNYACKNTLSTSPHAVAPQYITISNPAVHNHQ